MTSFSIGATFCCPISTNVHYTVVQLIVFSEQKVSQKQFQIFCCLMDVFLQIRIIGTHKRIAEVPCIMSENIVGCRKSQRPQVLNEENRSSTSISFRKHMNLPQIRYKQRKMMDYLIHRQSLITELSLTGEIVFQRFPQFQSTAVCNGISVKYPLSLCNVVVAQCTSMLLRERPMKPRLSATQSMSGKTSNTSSDIFPVLPSLLQTIFSDFVQISKPEPYSTPFRFKTGG